MTIEKGYRASEVELRLLQTWQDSGLYHFAPESNSQVFSIDTPPATVSGRLHLGHIYSYSHADFIARFYRMNGFNVFYPMGYDDNGLPTERLVEKRLQVTASKIGRAAFIEKCLEISKHEESEYQKLWQRIGLSVDWRYTYRTIDENSCRISQYSFQDLYHKGLVYQKEAPAIWCPECRTSLAQAELNDIERDSEYIYLSFELVSGERLIIATTRPELLPACVAVFVHPSDERYRRLIDETAIVPIFGRPVRIYADDAVDPKKGTGAVMCCTFGDATDVAWWYRYNLALIQAISQDGKMTEAAGELSGLSIDMARERMIDLLKAKNLLISREPIKQTIRVHERCDTPVEFLIGSQWFIHLLKYKERLLHAGEQVHWVPEYMGARYHTWVQNLNWDWCISRQRQFGVPIPVWYCKECGEVILANDAQLPVDPLTDHPPQPCPACGCQEYTPEADVMDTWATSSMSTQIAGSWLNKAKQSIYSKVFPFSLRPQGHEIIRTWAFYSIVKSLYHFDTLPWKNVLISGWGLAGDGLGKISKSRGGGPMAPQEMIEKYSADAVRYWAASSNPGHDTLISEEKIQAGARLVTKLWNVARFSERFSKDYASGKVIFDFSPADRWIQSKANNLIIKVTDDFQAFDYAAAKSDIEAFFWADFTDNYLEMCKQRLYVSDEANFEASRSTLYQVLLIVIKLLAPLLPFVTDEIYRNLFTAVDGYPSVHCSPWPVAVSDRIDPMAEWIGELLVEISTTVRRFKSENKLPLGAGLTAVKLAVNAEDWSTSQKKYLQESLVRSTADLMSITRAQKIEVLPCPLSSNTDINFGGRLWITIDQ